MKPSVKDWDENSIDLLLFQYLEGELSEEEKKELQDKLVSDVSLQAELAHWQDSIFTQDFFHTEHIEKNLLKEEVKTVDSTTSGFILVFVLLTSLFSFFPLVTKKEDPVSSKPELKPTTVISTQQAILNTPQKQTLQLQVTYQVVQKDHINTHVEATSISRKGLEIKELKTVAIFSPQINPAIITIPKTGLRKVQIQKPASVRKISGKERRKIERMKERALQRRIANKFMKGRVPYVVPLDTRNF